MSVEIILVISGVVMTGWIWAFTAQMLRSQTRQQAAYNKPIVPLNLMDNESGVIVAEGRGHLVYVNDLARDWFGLNSGEPNLAILAGRAQPSELFHELFADEGQATFRLGLRRIQATSHFVPTEQGRHMVIVMRELTRASDEEGEDPTRTLIVIQEISKTITSGLDLSETLSAILNSIAQVMSFDAGEITLWDSDLNGLRPVGSVGDRAYADNVSKAGGVYEVDEGFTGWIARYRQPLLLGNVAMRSDVRPKLESYPYKSYVGMPLTIGDRFIGTLELADYELHAFNHEDIDLLEAVAGQAAIAIENALLTNEQANRLMQLAGLQQILQTIDDPVDHHTLYEQLHNRIGDLSRVEVTGILLYDADSEALICQLPFYGIADAVMSVFNMPMLEGSAAWNIWHNQTWWYSNDLRASESAHALQLHKLAEASNLRNAALVPMVIGNKRIGALLVANKRESGGFNNDDMRLLSIFTAQATVVVENANLYQRERRHIADLGGLQELAQGMRADNLEELLAEVNQRIAELMEVETCGVLFYEDNPLKEDEQTQLLLAQTPFYGLDDESIRFYQIPVAENSVFAQLYNNREYWLSNNLNVEKWQGSSNFVQIAGSVGMKRVLFAPLTIGGKRLGLIQVSDKLDGTDFDASDARVLTISAGQAAVLIDNIRLYRDAKRLTKEIQGLQQVAEIAFSANSRKEIFDKVLAQITTVMESDMAGFGMLETQTGKLKYEQDTVYGINLNNPIVFDVYSTGFANSIVLSRKALRTINLPDDDRALPVYRQIFGSLGVKDIVIVPMISNQRVVGEFFLANKQQGIFNEDDEQIALTISAQVATALERVQLQSSVDQDLRARIEEQEALDRISRELNQTLLLDRILDVIRGEALRTTAADDVSVVLFRPMDTWVDVDSPRIEARIGASALFTDADGAVTIGDDRLTPIEEQAFLQNQGVFVEDYFGSDLSAAPTDARSGIVETIRFGEQIVGFIHLFTKTAHAFTPEAVSFIQRLAQQASLAVSNARRYRDQLELNERLRGRVNQAEQIFGLSEMLREGASLEEIMEEIAHDISETLGFRVVVLNTLAPSSDVFNVSGYAGIPIDQVGILLSKLNLVTTIEELMESRWLLGNSSYYLPIEQEHEWWSEFLTLFDAPIGSLSEGKTRTWTPKDFCFAPMFGTGDKLLGYISVDDPIDGQRPSVATIESLEVFASQAAFIFENFQLVQNVQEEADSARRERDRLAQLHLVSSEIQRAGDMLSRLHAVADGIISATGWQRVQITLRDEHLEPTLLIQSGYTEEEEDRLHTKLLPGKIWRERFNDLEFHEMKLGSGYYLRYDAPWVQKNIYRGTTQDEIPTDYWHPQDVLYIPLLGHDQARIIGMMRLENPVDNERPTEDSIRPLELFAVQAAAAIENTRLYQETQQRAQTEQRLNELMEAMASTLDQTEIVQALSTGLQPLIAFTRMHLAIPRNAQAQNFDMTRVELTPDGKAHIFPDNPVPVQDTALGQVYRDNKLLKFNTIDSDDLATYIDLKTWSDEGERSVLIVPMVAGGDTIGVLRLGSELDQAFTSADQGDALTLVQRMANLSAVSIQNSRLFSSLDETTSFNQAVVQSIQQGIVVLDDRMQIQLVNAFMVNRYAWSVEAVGRPLFAYRPDFKDFLEHSVLTALETGEDQTQFDVQDTDAEGNLIIRNFYTYPLRQGERITGVVLLVEDITDRALLEVDLASRAEQLAALTRVSGKMTETLKPDEVADIILDSLGEVIPYDGVTLWMIDTNHVGRLQIEAARGFRDEGTASVEELLGLHIEIEHSALFREMADSQRQIRVHDTTTNDPRFPYGEGRIYKSWLGAPLISKGEIIGVLQLEKKQAGFYNEQHEQLVLTFANQAAVALNNAQLFAETQQRAEELNRQTTQLSLLNRVSQDLAQSLDLENIFEVTLRETAQALNVAEAAAIQIDTQYNVGRLRIEYPRGDTEPTQVFTLDDNEVYQTLRETLYPKVIKTNDKTSLADSIRPLLRRQDVTSLLIVPMVISGSVVGLMRFDLFDDDEFSTEQIELARTIANQAAIAVQNASLFEQSVQRTYELETLFESAQSTATTLRLEEVLERVAMQMISSARADATILMLWNAHNNRLQVSEAVSMFDDLVPPKGISYNIDDYPVRSRVMRDQRSEILRVENPDTDDIERTNMQELGVHIRLFAPLVVNENTIGVAQLDLKEKGRVFETGQIRLIRTLASQAAVAIENARLQTETQAQVEELSLINEVSTAVSSTMELESMLNTLRYKLPTLAQAEFTYIGLYEAETNTMSFPVAVSQRGENIEMADYKPSEGDEVQFILQNRIPILKTVDFSLPVDFKKPLFPTAKSLLFAPMLIASEVIGLIILRDDQDDDKFDLSEQRTLTTIASQVATAIQNARLFRQVTSSAEILEQRVEERTQELDQERQRISTLYEVATEIAETTLDLDKVLQRALELISGAIQATSAVVLAIDEISDRLFVLATMGQDGGTNVSPEPVELRQNEGLAGWIIQNRQGIVLKDVQNDPRWVTVTEKHRQPHAAVATLLASGETEDIRGVIMFYSDKIGVFNQDHLRLVTAAARQLANAMNSAELYGLIRDQAERLGAILRQEQVESTKNSAILDSVADGVMYANEEGIIKVFNNTSERILGLSSNQVLNRHIRELTGIYGGGASGWADAMQEWMRDPTQYQAGEYHEEIIQLEDGKVISARLSPVNMGDQFLGTVSVFRDITREAEVDRLKSEFVATVSHELRTPMTSIKGYADLLLLGAAGDVTETQARFLETIKQNADRLSILVNDLLEVSRIDQGQLQLRFVSVNVTEVFQVVNKHISGRIKDEDRTLAIRIEVEKNLPEVRADYEKLVQIVQNLADNAFNYTPDGGKVTLGAQFIPDDEQVVLTVADTGIGIPEDVRDRVFERFFRGDEYSEVVMDTPGTGLGLAIVKELVLMHSGDIGFTSTVGEGTTFYVRLPIARGDNLSTPDNTEAGS